ncbi:mannosyltransferase [Plakobranchus ocellatus]|uniref:Mannosyltransferase n=1 Tax=Plakobranchus ocellatus TaxID=259542 RepID=A0AAV3ZR01_9GAST|nr:mannosyltransferase [Plakobranchus ocellatus]
MLLPIASYRISHLAKLQPFCLNCSTLLSWFTIYCCTRTLSNSTEASLIVIALSYFPWPDRQRKDSSVRLFLLFAALSVIVRPTAALVWVLLCCWHLQWARYTAQFRNVLQTYLVIGMSTLAISAMVDRIWYGQWIFVQLNFLWFNVVRGGASIYGTHPWHWYLWQGFPVVMGTLMFPFLLGAWRAKDKTLLWIIAFILATHSFLPHKEFRFILPTVPLAMHFCGLYFQELCSRPSIKEVKAMLRSSCALHKKSDSKEQTSEDCGSDKKPQDEGLKGEGDEEARRIIEEMSALAQEDHKADSVTKERHEAESAGQEEGPKNLGFDKDKLGVKDGSSPDSLEALQEQHHQARLTKARVLTTILAVTNLLPALYFCLIHQRGTIMVTKFLADSAAGLHGKTDILFLMPCHSTPYYR